MTDVKLSARQRAALEKKNSLDTPAQKSSSPVFDKSVNESFSATDSPFVHHPERHPEPSIKRKTLFANIGRFLQWAGQPANRLFDALLRPWLGPIKAQQSDWVDEADWARLQQEPLKARLLLNVIAIILLIFFVWAALAKVDEVARGEGRVIPSQQLQVIQSFDGGVVSDIVVHEGQEVNKGDLLLKIDPTRFVSSFKENRAEVYALQARTARLKALTSNTRFELPDEMVTAFPDIADHETKQYETNKRELDEQLSISRSQLEQRQQELSEVRAKVQQTIKNLEYATQELNVTKPLLASGAVSEVEVIRLQSAQATAQGAQEQAAAQEQRLLAAVNEAQVKVREALLDQTNKWRAELSETLAKLSSLSETGTGLADKIKYSEIRSPVHGTIQKLYTTTIGGVVLPGHEVIEIIPLDDQLLIEAKVAPKDIAFLHPGQKAVVKFTAYDFAIYGALNGTLEHISADTMKDEKENVFYLVRIKTDRTGFNASLPIIPGMTTQVDILTGKKTVLSYLLKPVLRAKQNALTER